MYVSDPHKEGNEQFWFQISLVQRPYCSKTLPEGLQLYLMDVDAFYIQNHAPVPMLDWETHDVTFKCNDDEEDLTAKLFGDVGAKIPS